MNNESYMEMACEAAMKSTCLKRKVGAIIVKDDCIIAEGCNGGEREYLNCLTIAPEGGCYWKKKAYELARREEIETCSERFQTIKKEARELCLSTCAERRAIYKVLNKEKLQDASIYCTTYPCPTCAKMIRLAGITNVYYMHDFDEERAICQGSRRIFIEAGIAVGKIMLNSEIGNIGKRTGYEYREADDKKI